MKMTNRKRKLSTDVEVMNEVLQHEDQCSHCKILQSNLYGEFAESVSVKVHSILASSRAGCEGCLILKHIVPKFWRNLEPIEEKELQIAQCVSEQGLYTSLIIEPGLSNWKEDVPYVEEGMLSALYLWKSTSSNIYPGIPVRSQMSSAADSTDAITWAHTRIENCLNHHHHCRGAVTSTVQPKRLIYIGFNDGDQVRLTSTSTESVRYVALSYCWGSASKDHVLTTTNITQYENCIPAKGLPKMFNDAIKFSRALNVQYIWIDALCILQDDSADWEQESAIMCAIFKNSYVTLSALGFPDPNYSLFEQTLDQDLLTVGPYKGAANIFFKTIDEDPSTWRVQADSSGDLSRLQPAMSRGWCYQERLLSVRTLHFTRHELYWDCCEERLCQCKHVDGYLGSEAGDDLRARARQKHHESLASYSPVILANRWQQVVGEYSGLSLTRVSDKLAAIYGVATEMQESLQSRYLCGLFERTILIDLCWHPGRGNSRFLGNPTWSWASMSGAVNYPWMSFDAESPHPLCEYRGTIPAILPTNGPTTTNISLLLVGRWTRGRLVSRASTLFLYDFMGDAGLPLGAAFITFDHTGEYASKRYQDGSLNVLYLFRLLWLDPKPSIPANTGKVVVYYLVLNEMKVNETHPVFERIGHGRSYMTPAELEAQHVWFDEHAESGTLLLK